MLKFEGNIKRVSEQEQGQWQFEEEIRWETVCPAQKSSREVSGSELLAFRALGAEDVQAEFSGYFSAIVSSPTLLPYYPQL